MACHPCLPGCVLASPLDIFGGPGGRNPDRGIRAPVVGLREAPAATADCTDSRRRTVVLSSSPSGPWSQAAGESGEETFSRGLKKA